MNKIKFLAFAIFISLFSFVNSMSKTKDEVKVKQREFTKEDLIKAVKSLDVKRVEEYYEAKGKFLTEEEFYEFRNLLDENWKWLRTCSNLREQLSLLIWGVNGGILPPAIVGILLGQLAKQEWFKKWLINHGLKVDFFELCGSGGYYCLMTAAVLAPLSAGLYCVWETNAKYGRIGSLLLQMTK
ncbi:hypothetical protein [Candidatus Babela massiliensis]|uniref:Uncharacterized protein n=1 Tax=Candidatus Babela massiliensis TaxID=673862 RepID=V6DH00_9BACT|nr:hypothetical protein [Candidatus Babela massiliensis]CDK30824.1 hypothetical protein BABL1_gene_191 [Candidatus Babela massiliensis]